MVGKKVGWGDHNDKYLCFWIFWGYPNIKFPSACGHLESALPGCATLSPDMGFGHTGKNLEHFWVPGSCQISEPSSALWWSILVTEFQFLWNINLPNCLQLCFHLAYSAQGTGKCWNKIYSRNQFRDTNSLQCALFLNEIDTKRISTVLHLSHVENSPGL